MINRRVLVRNIFSNWVNLLLGIVISFSLAPFVVHSLGNTYYGIWVIMMQFTGYLYLLDFGIREFIIRYVSKFEAERNEPEFIEVVSAGLDLYLLVALACVLITVTLAVLFPYIFDVTEEIVPVARSVALLSGAAIAQTLALNVFSGIVMGLQRYDIFNKIGIVSSIVRLLLIVGFLGAGYGIVALAVIQLFIGFGSGLAILLYARRLLRERALPFRYTRSSIRNRLPMFRRLYDYSIYVLLNNVGQKAVFYTDAIVIGIFLNAAAVTFYAIAGNLIEYLRRLMLVSNNVLNPLTSELQATRGSSSVGPVVINGARFSVLVALPVAATFMIAGTQFISLWMGPEYTGESYPVLFVLTAITLLAIPNITITNVLYGLNRHKLVAYLRLGEAALNLGLSILLVGYFGILGVAIGTAVPQFLLMVIILPLVIAKTVDLDLRSYIVQVYGRPAVSIAPFGTVLHLVTQTYPPGGLLVFFAEVAVCMPIYVLGVWLVGLLPDERTYGRSLAKRLWTRFAAAGHL